MAKDPKKMRQEKLRSRQQKLANSTILQVASDNAVAAVLFAGILVLINLVSSEKQTLLEIFTRSLLFFAIIFVITLFQRNSFKKSIGVSRGKK